MLLSYSNALNARIPLALKCYKCYNALDAQSSSRMPQMRRNANAKDANDNAVNAGILDARMAAHLKLLRLSWSEYISKSKLQIEKLLKFRL